jgi:hypothetical protein
LRFRKIRLPAHAGIDRASEDGRIADSTRQRAGAIQKRGKGDHALTRDAAPSWLEAHDAA